MKLHLSIGDWFTFSLMTAITVVLYVADLVPDSVIAAFAGLELIFLLSSGYPLDTPSTLDREGAGSEG